MNRETASVSDVFVPNPWLRIGADDGIVLVTGRSDMGQGATGGLVLLAAEELRVPPERISVEFAPAAPEYSNPMLGSQATGGSTSVRSAWKPLRRAAAQARRALEEAAAGLWGVDAAECESSEGIVFHGPGGKKLRFGELVAQAARRPVPEPPPLTEADHFRWIGMRQPTPGVRDKLVGRSTFGADVKRPGMLTAVLARCPVAGGRVQSIRSKEAEAVAGVRQVLATETWVAVLAEDLWAARRARDRLQVEWEFGPLSRWNSERVRDALHRAIEHKGRTVRREGNPESALRSAPQRLNADYETPYLAHAPLRR